MNIAVNAQAKKRPGPKGKVGELLPFLSDTDLRALIDRFVVGENLNLPPQNRILDLAKQLSLLRIMVSDPGRRILIRGERQTRAILAALSDIVELSPSLLYNIRLHMAFKKGRLMAALDERNPLPGESDESELNDEITAINTETDDLNVKYARFMDLKNLCQEFIQTGLFGLSEQKAPIYGWHNIAHQLAASFVTAMLPTNPKFRLEHSSAPCQRFISAVVPHITGEHPSVDAVKKWLMNNPSSIAAPSTRNG